MRRIRNLFALFVVVSLTLGLSPTAEARKRGIGITWLGHASFQIVIPGGTTLLIDPFLTKNPKTPAAFKDLKRYRPDAILLSHSHFDHVADAIAIAKASGAKVIGAHDHIKTLDIPDKQKAGGNVGGTFKVGDVTIHLVPAMHGSTPGGRPLGFIIRYNDRHVIYHTGDTWIFGDMALIQEIHKPTILLLQAGGGPYNQDPETAALVVKKYFKPRLIIPMHYGTFPPLADENAVRKAFGADPRVRILQPGDTHTL